MNVEVLFHYMRFCKANNLEPSFIGLQEFHYLTKGIIH